MRVYCKDNYDTGGVFGRYNKSAFELAATLQLHECCKAESARAEALSQPAELKLVPEERGCLRKAWGDVALVGNRTSEKGTSRQFR